MDPSRRRFLILSATAAGSLALPVARATPPRPRTTVVRHIRPDGPGDLRNDYFLALLRLALEKTARRDGPFRLEAASSTIPQSRALSALDSGELIDVLWTMTTRRREAQVQPVRIPLLRGLMGWRLPLIRRDDAARFAAVRSPADLRQLVAVQGHDWPDADILEANGLPVARGGDYQGLFGMLALGRADYFPRAFNEPWSELEVPGRDMLMVEPTLLLRYQVDNYFFVSRHNRALGERIERGLRIAQADGSFEQVFRRHPVNARAFSLARLAQRRIIDLQNPLLPPETPLHDRSLWYRLPAG
ncbi:MAG: hypothetical protein ACOY33_01190 [Pseudomonadota bacterium]